MRTITAIAALAIFSVSPALRGQSESEKSADVWLAGDVSLGDGGGGQLDALQDIGKNAAGIINLEGPVAQKRQLTPGRLRLWNSPVAIKEVLALNVRVAGIANNHAGDAGLDGPQRTAKELVRQGILPAGGTAGPALFTLNGLNVAVTAHDLTNGVPKSLAADLAVARKKSDFLIATFHVTGPPSYLPRPELRRAAEIAYSAGASVIAAHGTHAVGPVERREHGVIAWGLGNVAFACDCTREEDSIILRVHIEPGKAIQAEIIPIRAGLNKKPAARAQDPQGIFDLLEAIGSSKLTRKASTAEF